MSWIWQALLTAWRDRHAMWRRGSSGRSMDGGFVEQAIAGFHQDEANHWVAELACGHFQHVRHDPPWVERPWVITKAGRTNMLGQRLNCKKCDVGAPPDHC